MKLTCLKPRLLQNAKPASSAGWRPDTERGSRHERGYDYAWEKLRLVILRRDNGLCQCPRCLGGKLRLTPADQVHHIVGRTEAMRMGWTREEIDHPSNLQSINRDCHSILTAAQSSGDCKTVRR